MKKKDRESSLQRNVSELPFIKKVEDNSTKNNFFFERNE